MKKTIKTIATLNAGLCLFLVLLLKWGYPLGENRLIFERYKQDYPGPVNLTATSFPFGVFCQELYANTLFQNVYEKEFPYNDDIHIPFVIYNQDTLIVRCGAEGISPIAYFQITNAEHGHENESVQTRIRLLEKSPDISELTQRGYIFQKLNWKLAITSFILEPLIIYLILVLSTLSILLTIFERLRTHVRATSSKQL